MCCEVASSSYTLHFNDEWMNECLCGQEFRFVLTKQRLAVTPKAGDSTQICTLVAESNQAGCLPQRWWHDLLPKCFISCCTALGEGIQPCFVEEGKFHQSQSQLLWPRHSFKQTWSSLQALHLRGVPCVHLIHRHQGLPTDQWLQHSKLLCLSCVYSEDISPTWPVGKLDS